MTCVPTAGSTPGLIAQVAARLFVDAERAAVSARAMKDGAKVERFVAAAGPAWCWDALGRRQGCGSRRPERGEELGQPRRDRVRPSAAIAPSPGWSLFQGGIGSHFAETINTRRGYGQIDVWFPGDVPLHLDDRAAGRADGGEAEHEERAGGGMVRPRAKSSSILVSVVRSTAVRLEPTRRRPVWMSVTVAAVPSRSRTRGADAVRDRNLVVMAVVAGALANKRNARPTAEPAQHRTGVGRRGS
jgi:hypothetical protein